MGVDYFVRGYRPSDNRQWGEMKQVYEACRDAQVEIPSEVWEYFEGNPPLGDVPGIEVSIDDAVTETYDHGVQGWDVDITKLPPGVKIVRFYMTY